MKVRELSEFLQAQDQDSEVYFVDGCGCCDFPSAVDAEYIAKVPDRGVLIGQYYKQPVRYSDEEWKEAYDIG